MAKGTSESQFAAAPAALYGGVLLMAALAYLMLQRTIVVGGCSRVLSAALGRDLKGKLSPLLYAAAILLAFVHPALAGGIYAAVAAIWLVPDRRIERGMKE